MDIDLFLDSKSKIIYDDDYFDLVNLSLFFTNSILETTFTKINFSESILNEAVVKSFLFLLVYDLTYWIILYKEPLHVFTEMVKGKSNW